MPLSYQGSEAHPPLPHVWFCEITCTRLGLQPSRLLQFSLFGIADKEIVQLQRIQNSLTRVVTKKPHLTRSVPLLRSLHWLPIKFRINLETSLLTYKIFNENQPDYLYAMITHQFHPVHWDQIMVLTFLSLRLRPTLVQGLFALVAPLCGIGSLSLSGQLLQQHLSRDVWRHILFTWLSLRNCLYTRLSVDVFGPNLGFSLLDTELFGAPLSLASAGDIGAIKVQIWLIDWLIIDY